MFSTFLQELRGYLGKGFLLAVFVPTLLFASIHLIMYLEITVGLAQAWQQWNSLSTDTKIILPLLELIGVAFVAYLVHNLQLPITRLFEGYWQHWSIRWLKEPRRRYYLNEWDYLKQRVDELVPAVQKVKRAQSGQPPDGEPTPVETALNEVRDYWLAYFPPPGYKRQIRPTRLGNVLRASELYSKNHYGLDAVVIWPRLQPLLSGGLTETLRDKKIAMDFMLLVSVYTALFTVIWCPILAVFTNRWPLFLASATGFPLAWACYQTAVQSALAYGEQIKAIIDLHRHELLKALGLKIPTDIELERDLWKDLSLFFHLNFPPGPDVYQFSISSQDSHKFLHPETPLPSDPRGWQRIKQAANDFQEGLAEVFQPDEGDKSA